MRQRLLCLLSAALLLLSACGADGAAGSGSQSDTSAPALSQQEPVTTPFTLAAYPSYSFHPALAANRANLALAPLLYEPLFQLDASFQAQPVLCQSYTASGDGLTWTFTLRSGVTFSDGTPLTGQAVADALNTARGAESRYASRLSGVTGVETSGENTVTITLSRPNGNLPLLLDIPIALGTGDRPAGTGPYVFSQQGDSLSLTARSGWWQDKSLPCTEIPLRAVSRSDDLIFAFSSGDVSLVDVDLMGTNAMGYSGSYETWDYATTDLIYLGFNTQSGLCRSAGVRTALTRGIDRDAVAQTVYASHAVSTALPVHPASPLYDQTLAGVLSYAPEALVSQLEDLGVLGRELVLLVNRENTAKLSAAQLIAGQLESAGMEITVNALDFEDYTAALAQGDFDLYLGEVVLTADFDLTALLSSGGALNYGRWQDAQGDSLLSAFVQASGEARTAAARALFEYLNQQAPIAPVCFKNGSVLTQWGRLSGLSPVRGNVFAGLENWTIS